MPNEPSTLRGRDSRERILTQAAQLITENGVRGTSLDDIRAAAAASKSQLYHYFVNKEDLVLAVIERQTHAIFVAQQPMLDQLDTWEHLEQWADGLVGMQESLQCRGGCPIGSLSSELSDHDEAAREALGASFDQWEGYLAQGFMRMRERGTLRPDADPEQLAVAMMASLQGGLLLTQLRKSTSPLRVGLQAALAYVRTFANDASS